ncbi:Ribbon-helix-helix protein CopG domain-containing protein [Frankia sp. AiPs1]|uniref:hypothetical protein n=1 Tax=Frankia sp. AiPa1 TaxID=573492 RepID=UPI00202B6F60|nr:hypothetical protein [Frankia sp. AiPa1]MCL9759421.1 hypothetical protein [Frankia sp. AiPa1]
MGAGEYAERVNAAARLLEGGVPAVDVALLLSSRFSVSLRQARRYVVHAESGGPVPVPEPNVVFTVKLPAVIAERIRADARGRGATISAVVAGALRDYLVSADVGRPTDE